MKRASQEIQFELDSGRIIFVDLLTIETKCKDILTAGKDDNDTSLLVKRRQMDFQENQWFEAEEVHFILPENLSEITTKQNAILVTAILWSDSVSEDCDFSELMVVFFTEYSKDKTIEQILRNELHDLDWTALANDIKQEITESTSLD